VGSLVGIVASAVVVASLRREETVASNGKELKPAAVIATCIENVSVDNPLNCYMYEMIRSMQSQTLECQSEGLKESEGEPNISVTTVV
tara:strand:+ start:273 stop:536 length:264 start_codon:yes stop_codon:yes gene_type:complete